VGITSNRSSRATASTALAALRPADVAFLGECAIRPADRRTHAAPLYVQALCWSRTTQGWEALAKAWELMKAHRDECTSTLRIVKGPTPPPSWVFASVPLLGAPFRDLPAEESTLAAWIARSQLSFAVSIIDQPSGASKPADALPYRPAIRECLEGYQAFLKTPGYDPVRLVMAAAQPPSRDIGLADAFRAVRSRLRGDAFVDALQLRTCTPGAEPLALAAANLACAAIARHVAMPAMGNPIHDAVRAKLVRVPPRLAALDHGHRR
jgi:hypothetical protein